MDDEKFLDYDERHPEFYLRFEKVALQLIAQGRNHYSAYSIRDYLRMRTKLDASKDPAVQFVQQFQKGLALRFVKKHPQYKIFFRFCDS